MRWVLSLVTFLILVSCQKSSSSDIKFDSAVQVLYDGKIRNGIIYSRVQNKSMVYREIYNQLKYSIGQLNEEEAVTGLARMEYEITGTKSVGNGFYEHTYEASMDVSWPTWRDAGESGSYTLYLPREGSQSYLQRFTQSYGSDNQGRQRCLDKRSSEYEIDWTSFWYHYRPLNLDCPLAYGGSKEVVATSLQLNLSTRNSSGRYPEYHKIWEDGKLMVTAVFGRDTERPQRDQGVAGFFEMIELLQRQFGKPVETNLQGRIQGSRQTDVHMVFQTVNGPLDVRVFLVDSFRRWRDKQKFIERIAKSDMLSYNGHSELGTNIKAFMHQGFFWQKGQYRIYLLNGCDSFAYYDEYAGRSLAKLNQSTPTKYVDVISNSTEAKFLDNADTNMILIRALVGKTQTYRDILSAFPREQHAVVMGEEDNRYPLPF